MYSALSYKHILGFFFQLNNLEGSEKLLVQCRNRPVTHHHSPNLVLFSTGDDPNGDAGDDASMMLDIGQKKMAGNTYYAAVPRVWITSTLQPFAYR